MSTKQPLISTYSKATQSLSQISFAGFVWLVSQFCLADANYEVIRTETSAPDDNGLFESLGTPTLNTSSNIVFSAWLYETDEDSADDTAIYRIALGSGISPSVTTLEQVVREGEFFTVDNELYHIDNLGVNASYLIANAPAATTISVGEFNNLAMMLPLRPNSGDLGDSIIVVESEGEYTLVAEAGDTVASSEAEYQEFGATAIRGLSANNEVTFFAALDNTENGADDNTAIYKRFADQNVVEIVRKGDSTSSGTLTHVGGIYSNDFARSVFQGQNDSEDSNAISGIYKIDLTSFSLVVHEGDSAPVNDEEERIFTQFSHPRINNAEGIGFTALMRDSDGFAVDDGSGLFYTEGTSIIPIMVKGQSTPDGTATYRDFLGGFSDLPNPDLNDSGVFALRVDLLLSGGQSDGVFIASESEVIEVARRDDEYENGTLRNFLHPVINNNGVVAFKAELALEEVIGDEGSYIPTEDILIITDGTNYQTIRRQGEQLGGKTVRDVVFSNNTTGVANGLNDSGRVAYKVTFEDTSEAIYVWYPLEGWRSTAPQGQWDDISNWQFSGFPNAETDLNLNLEQDLELQGPANATSINSFELGGGTGAITFNLATGALTVNQALTIHPLSILTGNGSILGNVTNNGVIQIAENQTIEIDGELNHRGEITINNDASLSVNGLLVAAQPILGQGSLIANGEIDLGAQPKTLTTEGSLTLAATSQITLNIQGTEKGTGYHSIDASGVVTLAGTLNVELTDGFSLSAGNTFELLTASQINGAFDQVALPDVSSQGLEIALNQTATKIEVSITEQTTTPTEPDPEPESSSGGGAMGASLLLLLAALVSRRRQRYSL